MAEIVKIPLEQLEEGMVVVRFDRAGFPFPHYGKPFPSIALKDQIRKNGIREVYVRREKKNTPPSSPKVAPSAHSALESPQMEFATVETVRDIQQSIALHDKATNAVAVLLADTKANNVLNTDMAKNIVAEFVTHCIKSPEAFVNMTRLKNFDNYTYSHSVNVSALAIAIGRRLGMSSPDMMDLGIAALMHDIGKMRIPEVIINKPGKLTDHEYKVMKLHSTLGYDYLKNNSKMGSNVLSAVKHHHEKADGSGYPNGLLEKDIPQFAKIISIADVYDAITSERVYHKGLSPNEALKVIFSWSGKHFNNTLVKFFVSIMGVYPVGTLVLLSTNELAVIFEPNKNDPIRPKVLLVSNTYLEPIDPTLFDLTSYNVVTQTPYKTIMQSLDPKEFSMNTNSIIEEYIKERK